MSRKLARPIAPTQPPVTCRQAHVPSSRSWLIAGTSLLCVAIAVGAFLIVKRQSTPRYWDDDDGGPIAINQAEAPGSPPEGMVWIPGGTFWMGSDKFDDAGPIHKVYVDGFWMDRTETTNAQFAKFVEATGYVTVAERQPDPGFKVKQPCSFVFTMPKETIEPFNAPLDKWWKIVVGASWQHPEGPGSDVNGRENHPVVHICFEDAEAYAAWARKRLPTEAEWEFAARGGLDRKPYTWGDAFMPDGKPMANTWQGDFPHRNTLEDGYLGSAPVGSFPANGFGLHDMAGNVWEWCSDWYRPKYPSAFPERNPQGPATSHDPMEPGVPKRVQRGGSFLCCDNYCVRFMAGGRGKGALDSTGNHIGFRCVQAVK